MIEEVKAKLVEIAKWRQKQVLEALEKRPEIVDNTLPMHSRTFELVEVLLVRFRILDNSDLRDGIRYWRSNNRPVPTWVYEDAHWMGQCSAAQRLAHHKSQEEATRAYVEANKGRKRSAEEQAEMRAAFGPGEDVIDIFTGDRFKT